MIIWELRFMNFELKKSHSMSCVQFIKIFGNNLNLSFTKPWFKKLTPRLSIMTRKIFCRMISNKDCKLMKQIFYSKILLIYHSGTKCSVILSPVITSSPTWQNSSKLKRTPLLLKILWAIFHKTTSFCDKLITLYPHRADLFWLKRRISGLPKDPTSRQSQQSHRASRLQIHLH